MREETGGKTTLEGVADEGLRKSMEASKSEDEKKGNIEGKDSEEIESKSQMKTAENVGTASEEAQAKTKDEAMNVPTSEGIHMGENTSALLQQQQQQQHEEGLLDYVPSQYSANMSFSGTTEYKKLQAAGNIIESLERLDNDSGSETGEGRMLEVNGLNDLGVGLDDTSSSLSVLETTTRPRLSFAIYAVIAVLGFLQNGVLPTIIPLVSKLYTPCTYGATNSTALTLSPLFSLLVMWRPFRSQKEAVISTSAIGVGSLYILTLAFLQTRAPMSSTASGGYIHGMAIVIISCATAFTKSAAFLLVSRGGHSIAKSFPRRFKHGNSSPIAIVLGAEERGVVGNEEEDPRAEEQTGDQKSQGFIFHGNHRDDRGLDDGEGGEEGRRRRKRLEWAGIVTQVSS
mmetsp:Transcript_6400/g.9981  ORF Transcript_6400/g.9981 Transcript_6400/m.9981 type:complete len:400 (+) Transcript_6400:102-1301(+)